MTLLIGCMRVLLPNVDIRKFCNYTDCHDVDENEKTIPYQGGEWFAYDWAGVTYRFVCRSLTDYYDGVASSNMQNFKLYGSA